MAIKDIAAGRPLTATGGVNIGGMTATLPTNASTALASGASGFAAAGYIGEDGLSESTARSTEKVKAWGGDTVKILQTDFEVTYSFTFLESLAQGTLRAVYGLPNVTTTAATAATGTLHAVQVKSDTLPHQRFVFEVKDGAAKVRIVVPDGQITEVGDVTYSHNSVVAYQVTVEAFPDSAGVSAYKYLDDGVFSA